MDFCHFVFHCNRFRGTWERLIKKRRATTLKLVKPNLDDRFQRGQPFQTPFGFPVWFPFQIQKFTHRLCFFHFPEFARGVRFHTRTRSNNESDSTVLTVAIYIYILHNSKLFYDSNDIRRWGSNLIGTLGYQCMWYNCFCYWWRNNYNNNYNTFL